MIWWTSQPNRARSERLGIAELQQASNWLLDVRWRIADDTKLCADFEIDHLGTAIPLTIIYPSFFPDMPPQVVPRDAVRLSGHQYGAGGELCLEYRPDNWEPEFTGAMMIASARRLLNSEEPVAGVEAVVANAHRSSLGQDVRAATFRFILTDQFKAACATMPMMIALDAEFSEHFIADHWLAYPVRISVGEDVRWTQPARVAEARSRKGYLLRVPEDIGSKIRADYEVLLSLAQAMKRDDIADLVVKAGGETSFLFEYGDTFKLLSLAPGEGKRSIYNYRTIAVPPAGGRLPGDYARLAKASVAIVGCGSLGSKIAASLARSGVRRFVLVDSDLFFPGNLVRNELDWRAVGLNKPNALGARIQEISPGAVLDLRRINLGAQESSALTDAALVAIGICDLIVDASAEGNAFNLCAAAARNHQKPLLWGEVFGGGIGGLIFRLRPGIDPVPHSARRQILDWCAAHGKEARDGAAIQYGLNFADGGPPLVADDSDVSLMAGHMTRLATDLLVREETLFQQSAFAIGLKPGWIFEAPFDVWPIALAADGAWGPQKDGDFVGAIDEFIAEFFPQSDCEQD